MQLLTIPPPLIDSKAEITLSCIGCIIKHRLSFYIESEIALYAISKAKNNEAGEILFSDVEFEGAAKTGKVNEFGHSYFESDTDAYYFVEGIKVTLCNKWLIRIFDEIPEYIYYKPIKTDNDVTQSN